MNTYRKQVGSDTRTKNNPQPAGKDSSRPGKSEKAAVMPFAAGTSFGDKTHNRVSGLSRYMEDTRSSIELVKTARDALGEIDAVLHEIRALAERAAGEDVSSGERAALQEKIDRHLAEIDHIASAAEFKAAVINNRGINGINGNNNDLH